MTKESIIQILKERGLRITPQRLSIIDVLVKKGHLHPGARFIYKEAKKKGTRLSLSSTYENIKELCRYGIIKSLEFDGKENRCEVNLDDHIKDISLQMNQYKCADCGKDFELPFKLFPSQTPYCKDCIKNHRR